MKIQKSQLNNYLRASQNAMKVRCKAVAIASIKNTSYLQNQFTKYQSEVAEATNKLLKEDFAEDEKEIREMNGKFEKMLKDHQAPDGQIQDKKAYEAEKKEIEKKYPKAAKYQKAATELVEKMMKQEMEIKLLTVNPSKLAPTISGEEINACSFMIDDSVIA